MLKTFHVQAMKVLKTLYEPALQRRMWKSCRRETKRVREALYVCTCATGKSLFAPETQWCHFIIISTDPCDVHRFPAYRTGYWVMIKHGECLDFTQGTTPLSTGSILGCLRSVYEPTPSLPTHTHTLPYGTQYHSIKGCKSYTGSKGPEHTLNLA